ncbi:DUF3624 domain-containing protein [Shewanella baltica]|uniref:DUF3624 domain-containing protein n=1 Tax=Shewanella baltica TaxID=62322 RepID=UPI00217EF147|nr:DUF3624 domain-containing protein [Shewanella baltica]MCS6209615.1 DUF3624 domain-containing protein [Shewanella baltica]MCS6237341.1 DUF3624 domain-containing protein [Shewanella baltica]MCS6261260.1 DUF3624 domain-containing protein [Shewanella baltica]MCS6271955.1 DUF3624 domain-containing protein [Shewanella baltica]
MSCSDCNTSIFRQKIGRCKRCMWQLTALSAIGWPLWWWLYYNAPREVNSIALLFFCSAFTGLLALHLIVLAYRRLRGRE